MIKLRSAGLEAWILPRGATLAGLWLDGIPRSLVLGFAGPRGYAACPVYAGAVVGPVANRIAGATVAINGHQHHMQPNDGANALHSGDAGCHLRDWQIADKSDTHATLRLNLADGDTGLPGRRRIEARYELTGTALDLHLTALSDRDTVMNLAHHPYWSLDGLPDVGAHSLRVAAETYLPTDAETLPTGEIAPVAGTDYDFRTPRRLPVDRCLDANLCLSTRPRRALTPVATLKGSTGITLQIDTTEPGLQLYNGCALPESDVAMLPGQNMAPFAGVALEPQGWPDAPRHAAFPQISLHSGALYHQHTRYRLSRPTGNFA